MELINVYEADLKAACINYEDTVMKSKHRQLDTINKLLAHRPWAINRNHIRVMSNYDKSSITLTFLSVFLSKNRFF